MDSTILGDIIASFWPKLKETTRQRVMVIILRDIISQMGKADVNKVIFQMESIREEREKKRPRANA